MRTQTEGLGSTVQERWSSLRDVLVPSDRGHEAEGDEEERRHRPWLLLLIALVAALFGIWFAGETAARMWLEDLDKRLLDAGAGTNAAVITLEREHLEAYRAIAFSEGFAQDLESLDVRAIEQRIQPVDANHGIPMIDIVDADNRVVFAFRAEGAVRPIYRERRGVEIVNQALAGERDEYGERFTAVLATDEGPLIATAGAVKDGDRIVGALLLMTPVDELLSQARNLHGAHLTTYSRDRGDPLATTTAIRPRTLGSRLRTTLAQPEELPHATSFQVGGKPYREQMGALVVRHRPAGILGASLPDRSRQVAWNVMVIVAVAMLVMSLLVGTVAYAWARDRHPRPEPERRALPAPRETLGPPPGPSDRAP